MPRFRPVDPRLAGVPITLAALRCLAAEVIAPPHFFVAPDLTLDWTQCDREEISWEIFRGRLLDPAHTRVQMVFESWSVYEMTPEGRAAEPLLSLKLDAAAGVLYVVRGLECYVWEGYDSGGGVFLSRERRKWVRELVATLRLDQFADLDELRDEMICGLYHAVVGASRLPLTSVEAPLPAFSFGRLFYSFREDVRAGSGPLRTWRELLHDMLRAQLSWTEKAHLLETFLHAVPLEEFGPAASDFELAWQSVDKYRSVYHLLVELFNGVSLSPWTELTEKMIGFIGVLDPSAKESEQTIDLLGFFLRHLTRHLTSYDLIAFHHRGANYPDALLLDAVLKEYLTWIERSPALFAESASEEIGSLRVRRQRRRALRQAWIVRRRYEGHPVPDAPTSPGENNRVLPPSHPRVPEEQILHTPCRTRRLYDRDPLSGHLTPTVISVLRRSVHDLREPAELRELGTGIFLDRPLAADRLPGEPDASPLLSSVAFSRSIAMQRINALAQEEILAEQKPLLDECRCALLDSPPRGLPLQRIGGASRAGSVSLHDALLTAPDFEFGWNTTSTRSTLFRLFDFSALEEQFGQLYARIARPLYVRNPAEPGINVYDEFQHLRMQLEIDGSKGYAQRAGVEYPVGGLLVTRCWEEKADGSLQEHDLRGAPIQLRPR